jgi:flavin reductase (DIM6/NTAB) family NADH-FMN oxidoreductase RutF
VNGNMMPTVDVPFSEFSRLLHPFSTTLVTCQGKNGPPNALAIAWIMPVSLDPPLLVLSIRKERHSYKLLEQAREFVVNMAGFELARQVLYCGRKSGKDVDKFRETGLTAGKAKKVGIPIINECVAHLECRVAEIIPKGDHILVIGEVLAAYAAKEAFKELYDLKRFRPLLHLGNDVFTTTSTETIKPKLE